MTLPPVEAHAMQASCPSHGFIEQARFAPARSSSWRLFDSTDVDETRERISRIMQPHLLQPRGDWRAHQGSMSYVSLAGTGIGTIRFGQMYVEVDELDNYDLFLGCVSGHASLDVSGKKIDISGNRGFYLRAGECLRAEFSNDCEQLIVRIDRRRLDAVMPRSEFGPGREVDLRSPASQPWLNLVRTIVSDPDTLELISNDCQIAATYEHLLIGLISAAGRNGSGRAPIAPGCVRRAERFMEKNFAQDLSLASVAAAAEVPVRTLLDAFSRFREESPMRKLRNMRLDHAHLLLRAGDCSNVTDAALSSGISHLGRFSQDYRRRFGESPSRTKSRLDR